MQFAAALLASLAARAAFAQAPETPSKSGINSVDVGLVVVRSIQTVAGAQEDAVINFINAGVMPLAKTTLGNMAGEVQSINTTLTPYLLGIVQPLADAELANVPVLLNTTQTLVGSVKDMGNELMGGYSNATKKAVAAELAFLLSVIKPAVDPITTFAKTVAGTSTSETGKQIASGADALNESAGAGLDPLRAAVAQLV